LSRFYGRDPLWWLTRAPQIVLRRAFEDIEKFEAEESMLAANRTAVGTGSLDRDESRRASDRWTRAANGGRLTRRKANTELLKGARVGVRRVPKEV
jgi:hypothetical protein